MRGQDGGRSSYYIAISRRMVNGRNGCWQKRRFVATADTFGHLQTYMTHAVTSEPEYC